MIDRLIKKAEQMGIDVPALKRITSTGKKKKRSTPDDEEDEEDEELISHETDDEGYSW